MRRSPARSLRLAALGLPLLGAAGCGLLDLGAGVDGGGGGYVGYGKPTLQATANGVHFGPATPDAGSALRISNALDGSGRVVQSTVTLSAVAASVGASCFFMGTRDGANGVAPVGAASYVVSSASPGATADGTITPSGTESMVVPDATLTCSGSACDGGALVIQVLDSAHAEGYFASYLADTLGRGTVQAVCSFYLPVVVN